MEGRVNIPIRRASPDDCEAISRILRIAFAEYRPFYTREAFEATTPPPAFIVERMDEGPIWVAVLDVEPVGSISAVSKQTGLYLRGMGVLPAFRRMGIGWRLLEHLEAHARENGLGRMFLSTTPFLSMAIKLYERYGFRRTDDGPFDLFGTPIYSMEMLL